MLGYNEADWKRQFSVKMRRTDRIIPDYVIGPTGKVGYETAEWIWEAKYTINSHKQFEIDFAQAKSYALRLQAKGLGLASKEGIWISNSDFDPDKAQYFAWAKVSERDRFNEIEKMTGKKR